MLILQVQDPRQWDEVGNPEGSKYFFPSLARTVSGDFIPEHILQNDQYCVRCHEDVHESWMASAHHLSSFNNEPYLASVVATREFSMHLLGGFSLIALILAIVGIYGVVSYSVARRTREMGIRLALGARRNEVVGLVTKASMRMVVLGLVLGMFASAGVSRLLESMLYETSPLDPWALGSAVGILAFAGLVASWVPAKLGTRVDPIVTMRAE